MAPPSAISIDIESVTDTQAVVLPDPLTVNGVTARRAKATSDFFKGAVGISSLFKFTVLIVEDFWQAKS
jgi:hypothetical protein